MTAVCQCGCGEPVALAKRTYNGQGIVKGQPLRFLTGHQSRQTAAPACGYIIDDETGCWNWQLDLNANGYGRVKAAGRMTYAHIVEWERMHGPVPAELVLDHICRNRRCCNPAHLEPVTHTENVRRSSITKLTPVQALAARECSLSNREIGQALGVSHRTIQGIKSGATWRDLPTPVEQPPSDRRDLSALIRWSGRVAPDGQQEPQWSQERRAA